MVNMDKEQEISDLLADIADFGEGLDEAIKGKFKIKSRERPPKSRLRHIDKQLMYKQQTTNRKIMRRGY